MGAQSIVHADVLSENINFSASGGPKSAIFDPGHLDPIYFEVGKFLTPPICLKMPKCANFCTFGESCFKHMRYPVMLSLEVLGTNVLDPPS